MSTSTPIAPQAEVFYPDSDGKPMADNTLQFQWIVTIKEGLERVFHARPDVFVAGDLFWYPVEGHPKNRQAPDALVALGRPKGYRGSYMQWVEGGIAPQVVFEVLSPGNRPGQMNRKLQFYNKYGVEEYYIYDPDRVRLTGYQRIEGKLRKIAEMNGWTSPRLAIRFDMSGQELVIYGPDGGRFLTYQELAEEHDRAVDRANAEHDRANTERERANAANERAERMAAQLRAMGIEPPE
jgi:Uma2 family endonuclease